jgi:hypothetical protein
MKPWTWRKRVGADAKILYWGRNRRQEAASVLIGLIGLIYVNF